MCESPLYILKILIGTQPSVLKNGIDYMGKEYMNWQCGKCCTRDELGVP